MLLAALSLEHACLEQVLSCLHPAPGSGPGPSTPEQHELLCLLAAQADAVSQAPVRWEHALNGHHSVCPPAPKCLQRPVSLPACRPQDEGDGRQPAVAAALMRLLQAAEGADDPEGLQGLLQVACCSVVVSGLHVRAVVTPASWT